MKQLKNENWWKAKKAYLWIAGIVLLFEIFIGNFSTWKTLGNTPIVLAENVTTDENGVFSTEYCDIYQPVNNVSAALEVLRYDSAQVTVSLTDEGDQYAYELPTFLVVNQVEESGYQNIYPFGKVHKLQITVRVPEGTEAKIDKLAVNVVRPFSFRFWRAGVLFVFAAFGYFLMSQNEWMKTPCQLRHKLQRFGIAGTILLLLLFGGLLARSNPACVNPLWPHHRQYQQLAEALTQGTVTIGEAPAEELLEKENPYDTSALLAENIPFQMDYALYNGSYYAYFGIVPEVLFYLPYYLLTGEHLQNYMVVFALYGGMVLGVFFTFWQLARRYAKQLPYIIYLMVCVVTCTLPHYLFMVARPDIYNVPVMAGNAFLWLGSGCLLQALWLAWEDTDGRKSGRCAFWYGMAAVCMACIMGSRPQMILYAIGLCAIWLLPQILRNRKKWKTCYKQWIAFILPFAAIGALVFWYNYARFGNGFDFGATYSLTSNDMNHRGFNFSRILHGLYSFFVQPPVINSTFPFLESCELESSYMGKNIVEFSYGGILWLCPLLWGIGYLLLGGYRTLRKEEKVLLVTLVGISVFIAAFDINAAGILQRYMSDMVFGLLLSAGLVVFLLAERYRESSFYPWIKKWVYLCVLVGIVASFLTVITSADSVCLENYRPQLFYQIEAYFKF